MNIDLTQLKAESIAIDGYSSDIIKLLSEINTDLNEIMENVNSTRLVRGTAKLTELIDELSNNIKITLPQLKEFLDNQIDSYIETNAKELDSLNSILSAVDDRISHYGG